MAIEDDILIFAGSACKELTRKVCQYVGVAQGGAETVRYPEGNLFVRIRDNVRGRRVYVVQSVSNPTPNDDFMELLFWIDAFKRASAESVTIVVPYFSYALGDKKSESRVSIRARVCAEAIEAIGADRVVFMDLHTPQLQGFFRAPVDDLQAMPLLSHRMRRQFNGQDIVVVSPDPGFVKKARDFSFRFQAPTAIVDKRPAANGTDTPEVEILGDVAGKTALIVDDFTITGKRLADAAAAVKERGAKAVHAAVTHAVLCPGAMERIDASCIESIYVTDTVERREAPLSKKFEVVSVAPLLGEAIRRIHNHESISVLFNSYFEQGGGPGDKMELSAGWRGM